MRRPPPGTRDRARQFGRGMASEWWAARGACAAVRARHGLSVVGGAGRRRIGRGSASPLLVHVLLDELDVVDIERHDASRPIKTVVETIHIT